MFYLVIIEVMTLLIQFMTTVILKSSFFTCLSIILFVAIVGGFEYGYRKNKRKEATAIYRKLFYKISLWLGLYFPTRFLMMIIAESFPHLFSTTIIFEIVVLIAYIMLATLVSLTLDKRII